MKLSIPQETALLDTLSILRTLEQLVASRRTDDETIEVNAAGLACLVALLGRQLEAALPPTSANRLD
jgi:hypothetical protein